MTNARVCCDPQTPTMVCGCDGGPLTIGLVAPLAITPAPRNDCTGKEQSHVDPAQARSGLERHNDARRTQQPLARKCCFLILKSDFFPLAPLVLRNDFLVQARRLDFEVCIRFHDLRHTTASLLMMAGANPAAVQRILRHRDPRITTEVYGHLAPGYLQSEVDRLQFGMSVPEAVPADEIAEQRLAANAGSDRLAASVLQSSDEAPISPLVDRDESLEIPIDSVAHPSGFEPLTYGSGGRR
jgi:Phage integrase family